MDSVPFSKGYLLSSTPVQSSQDSGYFGSGERRYKSNVLNSCSPIKESSLKNIPEIFPFHHQFCDISQQLEFDRNLHLNSIKNESLSSLEINELELASSSDQNKLYKIFPSITKARQKLLNYDSNDAENTGFYHNSLSRDEDIKYKLFEYDPSDLISTDYSECFKNLSESSLPKEKVKHQITFKQVKIDFIHELKIKNCFSIISSMLSYLSAKELCIASCVSKEWNEVILNDYKANLRRENFIAERVLFLSGPSKENRNGMRFGPAKEHKKALTDISNINTDAHLPVNSKVSNTRFDSFIKEAKNGQKLLKCPKCCYASKYLDGDNCICTHCSYRFCYHCLDPILKFHTCFKPKLPNIVVGSRKSKKNLRRL